MVAIIEACLPCNGEGKLGGWFDKTLRHPCPWCNTTGKVLPSENDTFLRVFKVLPATMRACNTFGTLSLGKLLNDKINARFPSHNRNGA